MWIFVKVEAQGAPKLLREAVDAKAKPSAFERPMSPVERLNIVNDDLDMLDRMMSRHFKKKAK